MPKSKYVYLITSERSSSRSDEIDNSLFSNKKYAVGDIIELDGLKWTITKKMG